CTGAAGPGGAWPPVSTSLPVRHRSFCGRHGATGARSAQYHRAGDIAMALIWLETVALVLVRLEWAIMVYFVLANSAYALLLVSAFWEMVQHSRQVRGESRWRLLGSRVAPRISMLAPAYNEAATIGESVQAL